MKFAYIPALLGAFALGACSTTVTDEDFGADGFSYENGESSNIVYGDMDSGYGVEGSSLYYSADGSTVYFDYDSYFLTPDALKNLKKQSAILQEADPASIIIEGHCDERGTREYNIALGERRANAVKTYLVSTGVNPAKVSPVSYGKERPAILGNDQDAHALNRRAVIITE